MLTIPPLSLYIHFPWCIRKCPYCDFNSHTLRDELPEETYLQRLLADLGKDLTKVPNRELVSIFMGGGTPSLFSAEIIKKLLIAVEQRISFAKDIEITMEANPSTFEYERFADYRAAGINRLSIGIQSFQADKLKKLGRVHNDNEAMRSVEIAQQSGFDNLNLDLMHGLPNQTIEDALYDLQTAVAFKPTHLSWYQLTLEPNTLFAARPPKLPMDELIWEMQDHGKEFLQNNNYSQYEISAYSQPNKQCKHNYNYWQFGDYLGIGAGAYSKITDVENQKILRFWKRKNPKEYLNSELSFAAEHQIVTSQELPFEFMLNALRLYTDIPMDLFIKRTGLSLSTIESALQKAQQKQLLTWDESAIKPTDLGRRFYNDLVEMFLM